MTPSRLLTFPLIAFLLLAGVACGDDGTDPPLDLGFDPLELALAVDDLQEPLQASSTALVNLRKALPSLTSAGIELDRSETALFGSAFRATALTAALTPPALTLATEVPPELFGSTFVYDETAAGWVVDESRPALPIAGVRIIWYATDGTGELVLPVQEGGFIDLLPGSNTPTDPVMLELVSTGDSPMTLMDFGQWHDSTHVDGVLTENFGASGFFADTSTTVQFSLFSTADSADTGDADYALDVMLDGPATVYTLEVSGSAVGATGMYRDSLTATAVTDAGTTVMELAFRGTDEVQQEAGGTLAHDGTVVLDIAIQGSAFEFKRPGGGGIGATQASELNVLFQSMLVTGFNLLARIPLLFLL